MAGVLISCTLIKKKTKFSPYSDGISWKVINEEGIPNIHYEEMRKYLTIYEEAVSHI